MSKATVLGQLRAAAEAARDYAAGKVSELADAVVGAIEEVQASVADLSQDCVATYTHTRSSAGVHNFVGSGANGKVKMTANIQTGDKIQVNGAAKPAYLLGEDAVSALAGESLNGRWLTFTYDGAQINFRGGGGLSRAKLVGATAGTAAAKNITRGATAWVDGNKLTGTLPRLDRYGDVCDADTYLSASYQTVGVTPFDGAFHLTTNGDGVKRYCFQAPFGCFGGKSAALGGGDGYIGVPASFFGDATAANVLTGKKFSSASGKAISGTMKNWSSTIITGVTTSTADKTKGCYRVSGSSLEVIPANGYWGSWNWATSCMRIAFSSLAPALGITAAKIVSGNTVCGVSGTGKKPYGYFTDINVAAGGTWSWRFPYAGNWRVYLHGYGPTPGTVTVNGEAASFFHGNSNRFTKDITGATTSTYVTVKNTGSAALQAGFVAYLWA